MIDDIRNVLDRLGYHSEPVNFEHAVPYMKLRDRLSGQFKDTEVSQVLRHLPDLFVMHHKMIHGIFFLKLLADNAGLTPEAKATYDRFYPKDMLLLRVKKSDKGIAFECSWIDEEDGATSLVDALRSRFSFTPPKLEVDRLANEGWLV